MRILDVNGDGVISWDEFSGTLLKWLKEEEEDNQNDEQNNNHTSSSTPLLPRSHSLPLSSPTSTRKRKADNNSNETEIRSNLHKRIKSFFMQFKPRKNFDQIRASLAAAI